MVFPAANTLSSVVIFNIIPVIIKQGRNIMKAVGEHVIFPELSFKIMQIAYLAGTPSVPTKWRKTG